MKKLTLLISLLLSFNAFKAFAEGKAQADVKLIMESHKMIKSGLYEVISPYTGNVIYIFRDRESNMAMEVVKPEAREGKDAL